MDNKITSPYSALVKGKFTGLAGCAAAQTCPWAARCLRANTALAMRHPHECGPDGRYFIPVVPV